MQLEEKIMEESYPPFFLLQILSLLHAKYIHMKEALLIIPEEFLQKLNDKQDKIISLLEAAHQTKNTEFITEKEAADIFKRKSTWFWQMRKTGILPYSKVGKSIYYSKNDLEKILSENKIINI